MAAGDVYGPVSATVVGSPRQYTGPTTVDDQFPGTGGRETCVETKPPYTHTRKIRNFPFFEREPS